MAEMLGLLVVVIGLPVGIAWSFLRVYKKQNEEAAKMDVPTTALVMIVAVVASLFVIGPLLFLIPFLGW